MKQSLTMRMLKTAGLAFLPAAAWLAIAFLIAINQETKSEVMALQAVKTAFWTILFIHSLVFVKQWAYSSQWYLAPLLWTLIGIIVYFWGQEIAATIHPLITAEFSTKQWEQTMGIYAINGGIPLLSAILPVAFVFQRDRLKENPFFRQWFVDGRSGAGGAWAGIASFNKKAITFSLWSWLTFKGFTTKAVVLGRSLWLDDPFMRLIGDFENSCVITCASARSGKSTSVYYNVFLSHHKPAIIFDPRGEHCKQTFFRRCSKRFLKQHGLSGKAFKHLPDGQAYVFDPFAETDIPSISNSDSTL